ncbi:unnamed protein product [Trichogramma brassicae]|uniref:ABC transporter domain-containing protein n=1 Tax=Trichogramma brassicae TaxID=86971 RepID=A0A6H5HWY9_9HYME|nr:unnamed protein product [Trichogramma brassicae]
MSSKDADDLSATIPLQPNGKGRTSHVVIVDSNGSGGGGGPAGCGVGSSPQVDIQFQNVSYSVPIKKGKWKEILKNVSGEFRSGRLTAILGPSGAGKTSLLNLLAKQGPRNGVGGCMRLNGSSYEEQPELFRRLKVCYVPQDFALMPLLTCRETIYVAARLKLRCGDREARDYIIDDVAKRLGLQDCMETLSCRLSGGERKRLSIALEIITSPSVLLLDEPTSGLDSTSSNKVTSLLWSIARTGGCTVVCAVHQPSSQMTCLFDDLLVMSRGRARYCGPRDRVLDHFARAGFACPTFYNLAEFVLEVVTGQRSGGDEYEALCSKDSSGSDEYSCRYSLTSCSDDVDSSNNSLQFSRYAVSQWEQVKVLLYRASICIIRDNTLTTLRLAAHLIVGVLIGIVFYNFGQDASYVQSNVACVFFFAIFLFFANSMPVVQMFPTEATVFIRENTNHWYSLGSYYITKVLSDLPLQIICPSGFLAIAYYMTGQPMEVFRFFQVWLICTLFTVLAQSFGILTGAAFDTHAGMFLVPAFNIPMFLFAGFFLKLNEVPVYLRFCSTVSYFRYVYEGILQAIYLDRGKLDCVKADFCYLRTSERILEEVGMPSVPYSMTVVALLVWIVVLHALIFVVLRWKLCLRSR